jgi:hypothetical protein
MWKLTLKGAGGYPLMPSLHHLFNMPPLTANNFGRTLYGTYHSKHNFTTLIQMFIISWLLMPGVEKQAKTLLVE